MKFSRLVLHPSVSWYRVDSDRLQVRVPSGQHLTFDQHSELIEALLKETQKSQSLDELQSKFPQVQADSFRELLGFLEHMVILVPGETLPAHGTMEGLLDYQDRITRLARYGAQGPLLRSIDIVGDGLIADLMRKVVELQSVRVWCSPKATRTGLVICSDHHETSLFRRMNEECVPAGTVLTFIGWTGVELLVGPLVVPGESSCFECSLARRIAVSAFPDEAKAQLLSPTNYVAGGIEGDHLLKAMTTFAGGRHLCALVRGLFHIARPGTIETWNPIDGETTLTNVPRLPRCSVCGRRTPDRAPVAVRDFL